MSKNGALLDRIVSPDEPAPTLKAPTVFIEDDTTPDNPYAREWKGVTLDVYRILRLYDNVGDLLDILDYTDDELGHGYLRGYGVRTHSGLRSPQSKT